MERIRELTVKVNGLESNGSGLIYHYGDNENKYILTAHHCLTRNKEKRVFSEEDHQKIEIYDIRGEKLEILRIYSPSDLVDIAVITVKSSYDYPSVAIKTPKLNKEYIFSGFPEYLNEKEDKVESLGGKISGVDYKSITLTNEGALNDYQGDAKENTIGFSGAGIYEYENDQVCLIGILVSLKAEGQHGKLKGISIDIVNKFIKEIGLKELTPALLKDFNEYYPLLEEEIGEKYSLILKKYKIELNGFTPEKIFTGLKQKLYIPFSASPDILNQDLWNGWLNILFIIALWRKKDTTKIPIDKYIKIDVEEGPGNRFYFTQSKNIGDVIPEIFDTQGQVVYEEIREGDLVFINSKVFYGKKILKPGDFKTIVPNIDCIDQYGYQKGIEDISNPNNIKEFSIIHLAHLKDEIQNTLFSCGICNKKLPEVEEALISCLEDILLDLDNHTFRREGEITYGTTN
ncbi:MAG: ABC-three component system protein [Solibacillus sp.]|uniref:ABC-three component system protein n=1 Tax=Solibacillus sp. TaxID=1909654 RepID=UPI0033161445